MVENVENDLMHLEQAKALVERDSTFYPQIIQGLTAVSERQSLPLQKWVANFLEDIFMSTKIARDKKEEYARIALPSLLALIKVENDPLFKTVISCCASIYSLIFAYTCRNPKDPIPWESITQIRTHVLQFWSSGSIGVRVSCIKFSQRVILCHSTGPTDPRVSYIIYWQSQKKIFFIFYFFLLTCLAISYLIVMTSR